MKVIVVLIKQASIVTDFRGSCYIASVAQMGNITVFTVVHKSLVIS